MTWTTWSNHAQLILFAPGDKRRWTLKDALRSARLNGHLFYRKVGPLKREEVAALCAELYGAVDMEEGEDGDGLVKGEWTLDEAALVARAVKRARQQKRGEGREQQQQEQQPPFLSSSLGGGGGRRYTLRVPTRHCVADGSGGLYCALRDRQELGGAEEGNDMASRRGRLEGLAKGRR